jgi:taurine dioxygenase
LRGVTSAAADPRVHAEVEHPVLRTHPETGRKTLFVNPSFTIRFAGMDDAESRPLLNYLCKLVERPEFTFRLRWEKDMVTFLDNRCTQHYAINDYPGQRRLLHRVAINGERPV